MKKYLTLFFLMAGLCSWADTYRHLTVADGLLNNQIRQIVELPNGQIMVVTEGMIHLYNGREFVAQSCRLDSLMPLPNFGGHSFLWQGDSLLWLKDFHFLYLYDVQRRRFRYDYTHRTEAPSVRHFMNEGGGSVVRTEIERLNPIRPQFDSIVKGTSWEGDWLQAYCRDRQGGQWMGMQSNGLLYLPPKHPEAQTLQPVKDDMIRHMVAINDSLILMAGGRGIYLFNVWKKAVTKTLLIGDIHCPDISTDEQGGIWICTKQGLYSYKNGELTHYGSNDCTGFKHGHMRFALPLPDGRVLVCNILHHLGYFHPRRRQFELIGNPRLEQYRVMVTACLTEERDKVLVATQNGIFTLDTKTDSIDEMANFDVSRQFSNKFNCLLRDQRGHLWIGTQNGLLTVKDGKARRITTENGLPNNCIQSLEEDPTGDIWVSTSCGICCIQGENITCFDAYNGIPDVEMTERGMCLTTDGTLLCANKSGVTLFNTNSIKPQMQTLSAPVLTELRIMGFLTEADDKDLYLTYQQNHIELQLSALNYATPNQTRYRYRLRGISEEWLYSHEHSGLLTVHYNALPPGSYTFEAQASIDGDNWGEVLRKTFVVRPPWWLTWWAKLIMWLMTLVALIGLMTFYLRRKRASLIAENDERVNRLFELREQARHRFAQATSIRPEQIGINAEEEELIQRLLKAIGENMDNLGYTVDQLACDIGMSRANLYRKTQAMLGVTPNDFLRNVRLKHAAQLLAESDLPVNQVSLMVGFQTTRYFSQCFRKMFGVTPSEYRNPSVAISTTL